MKVIKKGKKIIKKINTRTNSSKSRNSRANSQSKAERYFKNKSENKKHKTKSEDSILIGVVSVAQGGYGFLKAEGYSKDFFIPKKYMTDVYNGDTVSAKRIFNDRQNDEVEIIKVLKRGNKRIVGLFFRDKFGSFVRPDDQSFIYDVRIKNAPKSIDAYSKVYVEIVDYPKNDNPVGVIIRVLGKADDLFVEEEAILLSKKIDTEFTQEALNEASKFSDKVSNTEIKDRLDLTKEMIFTIDGEYSRDFDDAVSLKIAQNGNYILGVHIADVSHYVLPKSAIDNQAYLRGNSVYLPDKVIPMLPFELSNGICSLNEGVKRLTLSVIAEIDKNGDTVKVDFYKSCIKSTYRLTYNIVQDIIDNNEAAHKKYKRIVPIIQKMNELKNILLQKMKQHGEIDLSIREGDVFYDNGKITVCEHKSNEATMLIEQFMIFANLEVGKFLNKKQAPALYRVHEKPTEEKLAAFNSFLRASGQKFFIERNEPQSYQKILDNLKDKPIYYVVNKAMLKSLQKARYSVENLGHFGLSVNNYLHFTSPIRRYSDLVVHRVLKAIIDNKSDLIDLYRDFCEKAAVNCSNCEKKSVEAERDIDSLYKAEYMKDYIGEEFEAVISSVTSFGVFVELENTVEGLVKLEYLPRDNYEFIPEKYELKGFKHAYKIGQCVKVGVLGVNYGTKKVEMIMLGSGRKQSVANRKTVAKQQRL